jgi:NAD(P)-dependent dehydrogenase (short-subunit alcohol dehydrogenase family)
MLQDKVALITGGASGIGRATAILFSRRGAFVVLLDRDADGAHRVAQEIEGEGKRCSAVCIDVASSDSVVAAFNQIRSQVSKVDILVNSAGIYLYKTATTLEENEWEECLNVDLKGTWACCKYSLPLMLAARGGSIINIASTHAVRAQAHAFPYGVAKGGMLSLTLSLAVDYGRDGVRVNAICPGLVFSPLSVSYFASNPQLDPEQLVSMQPLPVKISPEDIANAALFLASDMARCITGATLFVDGGRTIFSGIRHGSDVRQPKEQ